MPPPSKKPCLEKPSDIPCGSVAGGDTDDEASQVGRPETGDDAEEQDERPDIDVSGDLGALAAVRPTHILGMEVQIVRGRKDHRWSYADRLHITCRNKAHIGCHRSRSIVLNCHLLGERAAEAYLGAWLLASDCTAESHKAMRPSIAEQRDYLANHSWKRRDDNNNHTRNDTSLHLLVGR